MQGARMRSSLKKYATSQRGSAGHRGKFDSMSVTFRSSVDTQQRRDPTRASYNAPVTLDLSSMPPCENKEEIIELEEAARLQKTKQAARSKYSSQHLNYFIVHTIFTAASLAFLGWQAFLCAPAQPVGSSGIVAGGHVSR